MTTYAFVSDQSVYTTIAGPNGFDPVACYRGPLPEGEWVECPDDILPGDGYANGTFTRAPRPSVPLSRLDFLRRFTPQERIAARASNDPIIVDFMDLLAAVSSVQLDDPDTVAAIGYLEQLGILAAGRAAEILA